MKSLRELLLPLSFTSKQVQPDPLREIRIASPCSANWEHMEGNQRVRHCPECKCNVYNLSAMTAKQARHLIATHEGRLCTRFYQRNDGTMLTQDCPFGMRAVVRRVRRMSQIAGAALSAAMSLGLAVAQPNPSRDLQPAVTIDRSELGITLKIFDRNGVGFPNAAVRLTGDVMEARGTTDSQGTLRLPFLPPGPYGLTIQAHRFRTYRSSVTVQERKEIETVSTRTDATPQQNTIEQKEIILLRNGQEPSRVTMGLYPSVASNYKVRNAKSKKTSSNSDSSPHTKK